MPAFRKDLKQHIRKALAQEDQKLLPGCMGQWMRIDL